MKVFYKLMVICALFLSVSVTKAQTYTLGVGEIEYLWVPDIPNGYVETAVWSCSSPSIRFLQSDEIWAEIEVVSAFAGTVTVNVNYIGQYEIYGGKWVATPVLSHSYYIKCSTPPSSDEPEKPDKPDEPDEPGNKDLRITLADPIVVKSFEHIEITPIQTVDGKTVDCLFWLDTRDYGIDYPAYQSNGRIVGRFEGEVILEIKDKKTGYETKRRVVVEAPDPIDSSELISDQALNSTCNKIKYLIDKTKEYLKK